MDTSRTPHESGPAPTVALHACCGPCLIEPLDALRADGHRPVIVFANPNIAPADEYSRRFETLSDYARAQDVEVIELPYEPQRWLDAVADATDASARCRACYRLRLEMVAKWAAEHGVDGVATTLTVSPYQDAEALEAEAIDASRDAGVRYVGRDFRPLFSDATKRSRDLGMYRQNYCGCLPSRAEAQQQRDARKAQRKAVRSLPGDAATD